MTTLQAMHCPTAHSTPKEGMPIELKDWFPGRSLENCGWNVDFSNSASTGAREVPCLNRAFAFRGDIRGEAARFEAIFAYVPLVHNSATDLDTFSSRRLARRVASAQTS
jgi:hypothetical protein